MTAIILVALATISYEWPLLFTTPCWRIWWTPTAGHGHAGPAVTMVVSFFGFVFAAVFVLRLAKLLFASPVSLWRYGLRCS